LIEDILRYLDTDVEDKDEFKLLLKRRLTKKEYKVLEFLSSNISDVEKKDMLFDKLNIDEDRFQSIYESLHKKLNILSSQRD
jgi:DNA-binding winged helix-turn-helix (wHTH) protein